MTDPRQAQIEAYRAMPEEILRLEPVVIRPGWLDRRRVRVFCQLCGEGVNYGLEVVSDHLTICRSCFGNAYYVTLADWAQSSPEGRLLAVRA